MSDDAKATTNAFCPRNPSDTPVQNPYRKRRMHPSKNDVSAVDRAKEITIKAELNRGTIESTTSDSSTPTLPSVADTRIISDLVVSAADKAGMDGIDRQAIDAIIMKESGNSLFMQQQKKRDDKVNLRIEALRRKLEMHVEKNKNNNGAWRRSMERQIDSDMSEYLSARPLRSCKVVVDMDMFYMACELLSRPDITDSTPACVGGPSMITTSNYAARRYGVRAAMPGYIGAALVNQLSKGREKLIFCPMHMDLYKQKSMLVREVLNDYDPNLTAYSLDEVYMDLAPYLLCSLSNESWTHEQVSKYLLAKVDDNEVETNGNAHDKDTSYDEINALSVDSCYDRLLLFSSTECLSRAEAIVTDMRNRVRTITGGLTCSAGVAPNFMLAKIASDMNKPNGQLLVPSDHESVIRFLHPLPIRKVSGIGRVTEKILRSFDITTVQQLYAERALVRFLFDRNPSTSQFLISASYGCSSSISSSADGKDSSDEPNQQKGISRERTIPSGKTWAEVTSKLEDIARLLCTDMEKKQLSARTVYVKVKLHTFDLLSHGRTLPDGTYIHTAEDLIQIATELFHEIRQKEADNKETCTSIVDRSLFSVRLIGIRCTNFRKAGSQDRGGIQKTIHQFVEKQLQRNSSPDYISIPTDPKNSQRSQTNDANHASPSPKLNPYSRHLHSTSIDQTAMCSDNFDFKENVTGSPADRKRTFPDRAEANSKDSQCFLECPICQKRITAPSAEIGDEKSYNDLFNHHIDTCLNRPVIKQVVHDVNTSTVASSKQMCLFFGQATGKSQVNRKRKGGVRVSTAKGKVFKS